MTVRHWLRQRRPAARVVAAVVMLSDAGLAATSLRPETLTGWRTYVDVTERRRAHEAGQHDRFLVMDFSPGAAADRAAVLNGAIVVRPMAPDAGGVDVPSGMVHHWRGAVLVRGTSVADLMSRLQYGPPPPPGDDVLRSSVVARGGDWVNVSLRLQRSKIVTVVYDTEHHVTFRRDGATRGSSASIATKIVEVVNPGALSEYDLPAGEDRGFLWRLNAYWRYEDTRDGVIAECESITLSRGVPAVLRYLAGPLIESAARESMERTLVALRTRFGR